VRWFSLEWQKEFLLVGLAGEMYPGAENPLYLGLFCKRIQESWVSVKSLLQNPLWQGTSLSELTPVILDH